MASRSRRVAVLIIWLLGAAMAGLAGLWNSTFQNAAHAEARSSPELERLLDYTGQVFESVAQVVSPAVAYIESRHRASKGALAAEESGSGVFVRPSDYGRSVLLTNYHVVAGAEPRDVDVYVADGRLLHPSKVWTDIETDLAVLELTEKDLPAVKMGDSEQVRIGQWVLVIGSPFGLTQSVTHGIISAKHRRQIGLPRSLRIKEFLQTDAPINPGNSGGPLVNLRGELIGINTAIASHTGANSGVGFSIPINLVRWVTGELIGYGKVRRAFLGVEFPNRFDFEQARQLGLPGPRGAFVTLVHPNTPAAHAGVQPKDVILEFDGAPVEDENHLINRVSQTAIGKHVTLVIWRAGKPIQLRANLGSWEAFQKRPGDETAEPGALKLPSLAK